MERMMKNMESMTVKKAVLKRVAMMMIMMTMMLPVRAAIKNDAAWPSNHPVMHDALRQCQDVKLLTDWICYFNTVFHMLCMANRCTTRS